MFTRVLLAAGAQHPFTAHPGDTQRQVMQASLCAPCFYDRLPIAEKEGAMASARDARDSARANAEKGSSGPEMGRWSAPAPTGLVRYLPIASWLPEYEWSRWLVVDFLAGMTV